MIVPSHHELRPPAPSAHEFTDLVTSLGLAAPDPEADAFAVALAARAGVPWSMINVHHLAAGEQQFVGLSAPVRDGLPTVGRTMPLDHGFCPEVVARRSALVLPDVYAHPRFAGNEVVDALGIRTYAGAPLIYQGTVLGTVCFVGPEPRPQSTGRAALDLIKRSRDDLMDLLQQRAGRRPQ